ncbi:hypothetical protein SAMN05421759_103119 [Roseivivax lentus]|uniref:Uncharacterized protein n=1 Tax=Roseivivax lentus TaxID=633194 RepID=A0A1N7LSG9_9RHOB|nr:hypothetical protein [Roseivivax lentus]SIS76793.1 hypothetical protein SAMN05421759_103119 [Roseivivax lentus]
MLTQQQMKTASEARRALVAGRTQLWNLRLTAAVESGDRMAMIDLINGAITDTPNNCQCNSPQCNLIGEMPGRDLVRR